LWLFSAYAAAVLGWHWSSTLPLSSVAVYVIFTPFHDAVHRSVSKDHRWLNEMVGFIASVPFVVVPFAAFRFLHLRHHKYTNDPELDPDHAGQTSNFLYLPVAAITSWTECFYKHGHLMSPADILHSVLQLGCSLTILIATFYVGNGRLACQCVVLPALIGTMVLAYCFGVLPHGAPVSFTTEDKYASTHTLDGIFSVSDGDSSFLLTCLLLGQNFHSVHHLYPTIPFYQYAAVWRKNKARLLDAGVKLQSMVHKPRRHTSK